MKNTWQKKLTKLNGDITKSTHILEDIINEQRVKKIQEEIDTEMQAKDTKIEELEKEMDAIIDIANDRERYINELRRKLSHGMNLRYLQSKLREKGKAEQKLREERRDLRIETERLEKENDRLIKAVKDFGECMVARTNPDPALLNQELHTKRVHIEVLEDQIKNCEQLLKEKESELVSTISQRGLYEARGDEWEKLCRDKDKRIVQLEEKNQKLVAALTSWK